MEKGYFCSNMSTNTVRKVHIYAFLLICSVFLTLLPELAFASNTAGISNTIGQALCEIANAVGGRVGSGLGTLAVLFLGVGAFFGKVSWALAVQVGVGIAAIFGAAQIVTVVGVVNNNSC